MASIRISALSTAAFCLLGCQQIGPSSIALGRLSYNEIIQQTSKQQTFANIIRVKEREPTSFLDVTQINAAVLVQGTLMGGIAGIGAHAGTSGGTLAGRTGSASLGIEYQESPTITYQPLTGQALVSQISTPIKAGSIVNLYNSDWPFASVLTFPIDRLTPNFEDYGIAINALIALDDAGAITLSVSPEKDSNGLVISLRSNHAYHGRSSSDRANIEALWTRLNKVVNPQGPTRQGTHRAIAVVSEPRLLFAPTPFRQSKQDGEQESTNLLNTRSALGILKAILESPAPLVGFLDDATTAYDNITAEPWNANKVAQDCTTASFYTLLPAQENPSDNPADADINAEIAGIVQRSQSSAESALKCLLTTSMTLDPADYDAARLEMRLHTLRRYLLIRVSAVEPPDTIAYVRYYMNGRWYYIDHRDEISQKNFVLLGQFLTIQAIASEAPPAPTIPVGPAR